jgi:uncharacterized phage-like protein YoqJ
MGQTNDLSFGLPTSENLEGLMAEYVVAATGHRPPRLGLGYSLTDLAPLVRFAGQQLDKIAEAHQIDLVVSGMAQGWDLAIAEAAIERGLRVLAAVPFEAQDAKWPQYAREHYLSLLNRCARVEVVCPGPYAAWKFIKRDEFMVDVVKDCGGVLAALYDGEGKGGTAHTVNYAIENGVAVSNFWGAWKVYFNKDL